MRFSQVSALVLGVPIVTASAYSKRQNSTTEKRYAILDNDWSPAGSIPFLMALDAGIEILGLASSTSNTWQKQTAYHALSTLEVGNLSSCIPVYYGATHPLINTPTLFQAWESIHGSLPWEGAFKKYNATAEELGADPTSGSDPNRISKGAFVQGFPNVTAVEGTSAAAMMVRMVRRYPGQVSIYAAGALTNVALAVRMDDGFAGLARELVVMGGYVDVNLLQTSGDILQADINSDINLMIDPEAAKIALTALFPNIVIAGNVANQVMSTQAFLDEVYEVENPYSYLMNRYYNAGGTFPFWDETAMAVLLDRGVVVNCSTVYIDVDTAYSSPNYGNIHVYQEALMPPGLRNVTYVHEIDEGKLREMDKRSVQFPKSCKDLR
ncbi:hypothetical protein HYALB_00007738 [Hymenoscyphus albidus]|uniref:Inosine/uridine-preferring nucleoside hydrolase domain-containing protein n=1 Tax=Hymenoscyphus albidus TaxID=595503 RepID=A0A9N9LFI9_9HELO|nr:hypothetical protein HYALB_00007738 [Hymenoscyphus albidus]